MFRRAIPTALAVALSLFCVVGPTSALADDPVDDCAADVTTTCALTSPTFTTSGSLGQNGDMDWIRFTAPQNGAWLFTVESGNMRVVAQLLKDYNPLVYAVQSGHITFGQSLAAGETVYVAIYAQWGESGPYTVHAALGATIAGTVTPNNVPLPEPGTYTHTEAYVCPVTNDVVGSCLNVRSTNPWAPPTSTWSAVVEPGKKYVVYASVDGYLRTYLGGRTESPYVDPVRTPSAVSGVTVVTAPAVGGTLSNQSITLALAASISGTVTVPSGHTLIEDYGDAGQVTAFAPVALPGGSTALTRWGAVSIEADGHYALDSVAAGAQYAICVSRVNSSPNDLIRSCAGGGRAPSVFEGVAVPPADLAALTWVTAPSAGATTTGVNIALQAAAHIKGTVSLPGGLALPTDDWGGVAGSMDVYKVGADGTLSS
ncbi:MAG: hypothetical protein LBN10_04955, partial [Propionibacteriaceae bacterium]|nr:hypothetical protein [Propionibacteriaceae bacterium]